ncbi:MAG: response regulator transcription factor [Rhodocyclales bacterium]|nr:response regulator transcription factor [Rhodocyclales bacterium]
MRILLIEDDPVLGDGLATGLRQSGFAVDWLKDGESAVAAMQSEKFDLTVLDLGLPRLSGMEVLKRLRARGDAMPVLVLTARDAIRDKIAGLDCGADDYLVKPVDLEELAARIRALLRRAAGRAEPMLRHGAIALDPAGRRVEVDGRPVELSAREYAVLHALLANPGRVMSRSQLEQSIYGWNEEPDSNALEVHIHHLRRKFGADLIKTLRGVGYTIPKA